MLKDKTPQQFELEMVAIDQLIPKDHLVRLIDHEQDRIGTIILTPKSTDGSSVAKNF